MGPSPRGGAYTYDWIENLLRLNMHSADRVLPEFQHPQLGDTSATGPTACYSSVSSPSTRSPGDPRTETGSGVRARRHRGQTRLISRNRFRLPSLSARIGMVPMEPASLVMERKMLEGSSGVRSGLRTKTQSHGHAVTWSRFWPKPRLVDGHGQRSGTCRDVRRLPSRTCGAEVHTARRQVAQAE